MKNSYIISAIFFVCGVPLTLCVLFWAFTLGSVGPMIHLAGFVNLIVLTPLVFVGAEKAFKIKNRKTVLAFGSLIIGVLLAVLGINLFIGLTWAFGLNDYQMM